MLTYMRIVILQQLYLGLGTNFFDSIKIFALPISTIIQDANKRFLDPVPPTVT